MIANWEQFTYKTIYQQFFPYKIFRKTLMEAAGSIPYEHWRTRILREQKTETLQEIIDAEYELAWMTSCESPWRSNAYLHPRASNDTHATQQQ